ncbi:MAG: FmdB family zinc ribbon protein [Candidatus Limnocylindrales bacterium]
MPTYDYVCTVCGHRLEVIHGLHGHGPSACPVCGGEMRKAFAPPTFHFKGSGWARKDRSASGSGRRPKPAGAGEGGDAGASSTAGSSGPSSDGPSAGGGEPSSSAGSAPD